MLYHIIVYYIIVYHIILYCIISYYTRLVREAAHEDRAEEVQPDIQRGAPYAGGPPGEHDLTANLTAAAHIAVMT